MTNQELIARLKAVESLLVETVTRLRVRDMLDRSDMHYEAAYIEGYIVPSVRGDVKADLEDAVAALLKAQGGE